MVLRLAENVVPCRPKTEYIFFLSGSEYLDFFKDQNIQDIHHLHAYSDEYILQSSNFCRINNKLFHPSRK